MWYIYIYTPKTVATVNLLETVVKPMKYIYPIHQGYLKVIVNIIVRYAQFHKDLLGTVKIALGALQN